MTKPLEVLKAERDLILQSQKQVFERMERTHKHATMLFDCYIKNEEQLQELDKTIMKIELFEPYKSTGGYIENPQA